MLTTSLGGTNWLPLGNLNVSVAPPPAAAGDGVLAGVAAGVAAPSASGGVVTVPCPPAVVVAGVAWLAPDSGASCIAGAATGGAGLIGAALADPWSVAGAASAAL